jgi:hypothetical protein
LAGREVEVKGGTCGFCGAPAPDPAHPYCCDECFVSPERQRRFRPSRHGFWYDGLGGGLLEYTSALINGQWSRIWPFWYLCTTWCGHHAGRGCEKCSARLP